MNIYFAGSIRGGRENAQLYRKLIDVLARLGSVLTEHVGDLTSKEGEAEDDRFIFERDMRWLESADVVIAEVSTPSLGVGFEISRAFQIGKRILCLYRSRVGGKVSAMISGCPGITLVEYTTLDEAEEHIERFIHEQGESARRLENGSLHG
jgi:nucleoside 2-deoxyribosyltransferase